MMFGLWFLATLAGCAFLNRCAGNGLCGLKERLHLRGKPMLYVMPLISMIAFVWTGEQEPIGFWPFTARPWLAELSAYRLAIAWTAAYAFWRCWEHGRWINLANDNDPNRAGIAMTAFERLVSTYAYDDLDALFIRHLTIWPGLIAAWLCGGPFWLALAGIPIADALTHSHSLAKRLRPDDFHWLAEAFHGAIFGALLCLSAF